MKIRTVSWLMACAALLTGCATEGYVNEQIASLNKRVDDQAASRHQALENRINSQQAMLDGASRTAQEALARADAAGKLAAGKFLYEVTLTSQVARFEFDDSTLSPDMKAALDAFATQLKTDNRNVYIEIQGHTDSIGSDAVNLALGLARAEAVRRYLAMQGGIALHRMSVISYGESAPVASNMNRAGRAENRRVTLVVMK